MSNTPISGGRGSFTNPTDAGANISNVYARGEGDWERLSDTSSQTRLKRTTSKGRDMGADFSYEVGLSERRLQCKFE